MRVIPGSHRGVAHGHVETFHDKNLLARGQAIEGIDESAAVAGQSGNFELNTMLPVIAYNLLQSIELLTRASRLLAEKALADFSVNEAHLQATLARNPILATALSEALGYDKSAEIAKRAYAENRPLRDVAAEMSDLSDWLADIPEAPPTGELTLPPEMEETSSSFFSRSQMRARLKRSVAAFATASTTPPSITRDG